jgi:S1-C subfamily serine protease
MHRALLAIALTFLGSATPLFCDGQVVQKFQGNDTNVTTATFTVQDKWELLYFSPHPMDVTILAADGTIVAGFKAVFRGSLFQAKGGTYYLQINSNHPEIKMPWQLVVANVASGTTLGPEAGGMFANTADPNYTPPTAILAPGGGPGFSVPMSMQTGSTNPPGQPAPLPSIPSATPAPTVKLTEDQASAVVLIKGDNAEGTGFMVKTPDGPVVITNIHVIANNPNLKITTNTGAFVKVLSKKGASDRDLAVLSIQDLGYSYLQYCTDISKTVQPGDEVITPGNSQGGEVMLNTDGKVLGIGPDRVEFDNPIYHGNSGGPIFHVKSGTVIGVVTEAIKVDTSDALDKASFASRASAITSSMRYFGMRIDTVTAWEPIEDRRFLIETAFLDQFNHRSRCLDCYLNAPDDDKPEDILWREDKEIVRDNSEFFSQIGGGADVGQQVGADREMWAEFNDLASTDMDSIIKPENFYSFDRGRAADEAAYRKAIQDELKQISNDVSRLGSMPRTNNSN